MICAYLKCGKQFEPLRSNQIYHSGQCRELAKAGKVVVVKGPRNLVAQAKRTLSRKASRRRGVTPLPANKLWGLGRQRSGSRIGGRSDRPSSGEFGRLVCGPWPTPTPKGQASFRARNSGRVG
jgi:hypothetical protein